MRPAIALKSVLAAITGIAVTLGVGSLVVLLDPEPAHAQTNNNDYTPLGSRIRRDRPLPNEPRSIWAPRQLNEAQRTRSRTQVDQMARCLWNRSNEDGLDLLARSDFGFVRWEQLGLEAGEVRDHYAIVTCLRRAARNANTGLLLRYDAAAMRRWYIQAAYLDRYEDSPSWIRSGYVVREREYPLSGDDPGVVMAMDFADCLISEDPHGADFLFRTAPESDQEMEAIQSLVPAISQCVPAGQEMEIDPFALRVWVGEGLWHVSNNLVAPDAVETQEES